MSIVWTILQQSKANVVADIMATTSLVTGVHYMVSGTKSNNLRRVFAGCGITIGGAIIVYSKLKSFLEREFVITPGEQLATKLKRIVEGEEQPAVSFDLNRKTLVLETEDERLAFMTYLVYKGKAKFGCPSRTPAMYAVVREFLVDEAIKLGCTDQDITNNIEEPTVFVFVPTRHQIQARQSSFAPVVYESLRDYHMGRFLRSDPLGSLFGSH